MKKMKLSARNVLKGKVEAVDKGPITASVKIKIEAGEVTATITKESVEDLEIKVGDEVVAVIKSTEVMVGKE
jgi:molybdopterin-binding protein